MSSVRLMHDDEPEDYVAWIECPNCRYTVRPTFGFMPGGVVDWSRECPCQCRVSEPSPLPKELAERIAGYLIKLEGDNATAWKITAHINGIDLKHRNVVANGVIPWSFKTTRKLRDEIITTVLKTKSSNQ